MRISAQRMSAGSWSRRLRGFGAARRKAMPHQWVVWHREPGSATTSVVRPRSAGGKGWGEGDGHHQVSANQRCKPPDIIPHGGGACRSLPGLRGHAAPSVLFRKYHQIIPASFVAILRCAGQEPKCLGAMDGRERPRRHRNPTTPPPRALSRGEVHPEFLRVTCGTGH
jgi:hypothetical protein